MRYALVWTMVAIGLSTSPAWAQQGGGDFGMASPGESMASGEMGMGGGFGMGGYGGPGGFSPGDNGADGIRAFSGTAVDGGKFQVIWTGPEAAKSQAIGERLAAERSKVQFIDTLLEEVVGYLQGLHELSIVIDYAALKEADISHELPVTANISGQTAAATLDLLCDRYQLGWYVDKGLLMLTTQEAAAQHQSVRIYKLHQLRASGAAEIVTKMVQPDSWVSAGGKSDVVAITDRQMLVIRQNRAAHDEIESLLKSLEAAK
ncbi:hypothetical protein [Blastopirellula marina]|uniref:Uncharacterized protein n=1 Tax=Blastopirellula marina TaxID=124 RepID=A0A2S8FHM8_9BACT|nr:hypothetical protein [Blastopirellula marina]PQO31655.1 hypothetical protein C5Y98_19765 [Blastopirellula marina]PTL42962.1 hypothetical protein C5Y97_19775 [Blastopirellula marina]